MNTENEYNKKFIFSCIAGDLEAVNTAINNGIDIHYNDDDALQYAVLKGHLSIVKALLKAGTNVHANNNYCIRWVVKNNYKSYVKNHQFITKLLIKYGANIYAEDSIINSFIKDDNLDIFQFLVQQKIKITHDKIKYLQYCYSNCLPHLADYLLEHLIDLDNQNNRDYLLFSDVFFSNKLEYCISFYQHYKHKDIFLEFVNTNCHHPLKEPFLEYVALEELKNHLETDLVSKKSINVRVKL